MSYSLKSASTQEKGDFHKVDRIERVEKEKVGLDWESRERGASHVFWKMVYEKKIRKLFFFFFFKDFLVNYKFFPLTFILQRNKYLQIMKIFYEKCFTWNWSKNNMIEYVKSFLQCLCFIIRSKHK